MRILDVSRMALSRYQVPQVRDGVVAGNHCCGRPWRPQMDKLIGHARVPTRAQDAARQLTDLLSAGSAAMTCTRTMEYAAPGPAGQDSTAAGKHCGRDISRQYAGPWADPAEVFRQHGIGLRVLNLEDGDVDTAPRGVRWYSPSWRRWRRGSWKSSRNASPLQPRW